MLISRKNLIKKVIPVKLERDDLEKPVKYLEKIK